MVQRGLQRLALMIMAVCLAALPVVVPASPEMAARDDEQAGTLLARAEVGESGQTVLTLGVLAWRGDERAREEWGALAAYLSEALDGYRVRLVPLYLHEMYEAVASGRIDLVLTQPASFVELAADFGLSQLVTLRNVENGYELDRFGAVLIRAGDRDDLQTLADLRGKTLAGVAENAFGGWLMGVVELKRDGFVLEDDITPLYVGLPQQRVVRAVLEGRADAGVVRTGVVEMMLREGEIQPGQIEAVAPRHYSDFPLMTSTDLYPEWPLAVRQGLPYHLSRDISLALMTLPKAHPVNEAAGIAGWSIPLDYSNVRRLLQSFAPEQTPLAPRLIDTLRHHWPWLLLAGALIITVFFLQGLSTQRRLAGSRRRLLRTLDSLEDAVITLDEAGGVLFLNEEAMALTGVSRSRARGRPFCELFPLEAPDGDQPAMECLGLLDPASLKEDDYHRQEFRLATERGERIMSVTIGRLASPDRDGQALVVSLHDMTELRRAADKLAYRVSHDGLTGLFNRSAFEQALARHCERVLAEGFGGGVLWLDLDGFRAVNENASHAAGDELLKRMAGLLALVAPEDATVARAGTDEFALLLPRAAAVDLMATGEKLLAAVRELRVEWQGVNLMVGASIGAVVIERGNAVADGLLKDVVTACEVARQFGGNRVHLHHPDDSEVRAQHAQLECLNQLREALRRGGFGFMAQRIDALSDTDEAGVHYELLIRMRRENGTLVPPGEFVTVAERYRMMPEIDRWVIATLFRELKDYQRHVEAFAINLSADSVQDPGMVDFILFEAQKNGIDPRGICFEITETAAIINVAQVTDLITRLREEGFRFALDDFGGGLLSFDFLRHFRVDYLKIDGKLVRDIEHDPVAALMVEAVNRIGLELGARTIGEWVETESMLQKLDALGVTHAQGFHLHQPEPLADVLRALAAGTARRAMAPV